MTFLYPDRPLDSEAALFRLSNPYGQVSHEPSSPKPDNKTCPDPIPYSEANGEIIRHILIGSPEGVRETIHLLHIRDYVEQSLWTGLIAIGENGVNISRREGQVLAYLMRQRSLDVPRG